MLLTITTTHTPATDLGYLLAKNPARAQTFELTFGKAHVVYPEASAERCTIALLLDVDPVALVRGRGEGSGLLDQYVNDRPYVASSFLSVAIADVLGTALNGRSRERPELVETPIRWRHTCPRSRRAAAQKVVRRLFAPLGYALEIAEHQLDPQFPEWGASRLVSLTLRGTVRLADLLTHLYVPIPVLDANKHYYFGDDELEKLLRRGEGWLAAHPERELITGRYLKRRRLVRAALERLVAEEAPTGDEPGAEAEAEAAPEPAGAPRQNLHEQRLNAVVEQLRLAGARSVLDLGCGEGRLLRLLLADRQFERILGMDVAYRALETARDRLHLDRLPPSQAQRLTLMQGSLLYRDARLADYDAAAVVEVIEHLDPARLAAFERVLFEFARPGVVVLTTPNAEYNVRFPTLTAGTFRHADHRFEWSRAEFQSWAGRVATAHGYQATLAPVGPEDIEVGAPSQIAVFRRAES